MVNPVVIPINAIANQSLQVPLSSHQFTLVVQQRSTGLYMTISMDGVQIIASVLCQDRTWIVRRASYGLPGDFAFLDTQGTTDPTYTGLGSRYTLIYQEGQNAV